MMAPVYVNRPVYTRETFDESYVRIDSLDTKACDCKRPCCNCTCSRGCVLKTLTLFIPFIQTVRTYQYRKFLYLDALAGLSVAMVHIPQGLGFALLAGVSPVYGLYASFWQTLLYMMFGSCRHLSIGTMALISLIIRAVVEREVILWKELKGHPVLNMTITTSSPLVGTGAANFTPTLESKLSEEDLFRASVATGVSLIASITMLAMGILRLGFAMSFMPKSFIGGFTTAAAFHILTTQVKPLLQLPSKRYGGVFNFPLTWYGMFITMPEANIADLVVTILSFAFLITIKEVINVKFRKRLPIPIPAEMILVVIGTVISYLVHLHEKWNVQIVGFIPKGIPVPVVPNLDRATSYVTDGIAAGVTSFAISIAMVDILTSKHRYKVDVNGELIAYGLTYGISSFLHCFAGAAAPPRCFVMDLTGGKTQMASAFTSVLLLLVLLVIAPGFKFIPSALLASIIVVALFPLFKQFRDLPRYWRLSKPDLLIWIVTFLVSVFIDISIGLGIGIVVAVLTSVYAAMCARGYRHGMTEHTDLRAPLKIYKGVTCSPDVVVFMYEYTLYFVTISNFKKELFKETVDPMQLAAIERSGPGESTQGESKSTSKTMARVRVTKNQTSGVDKTRIPHDNNSNEVVEQNGTDVTYVKAPEDQRHPVKTIILDCSPIGYVDLMGIATLKQLHADYKAVGIDFLLANCNPFLLRKLEIDGLIGAKTGDVIPIYPTIQDALHRKKAPGPIRVTYF